MFIFPLLYLTTFIFAASDILKGNKQGFFLFIIFGLSIYSTALSVMFILGLRDFIFLFQFFKEILVLVVLSMSIWFLKERVRFHFIDYAVMAFFIYILAFAILPIGEQTLVSRLLAFKTTSFFALIYFIGRLYDPETLFIGKFFNYILLLSISAGVVVAAEVVFDQHLQTLTGYADYSYYLFNFEPSGNYGLSWTFESEGGFKRFASFFANPLEHAAATVMALAIIGGLYTTDEYRFKIDTLGLIALACTFISITFAISRASFVSYFLIIYVYALITRKKFITNAIHLVGVVCAVYLIYLITASRDEMSGLQEMVVNTLDFSNPSSIGHIIAWMEGILAIAGNPFGLGMGTSGRVGGSVGDVTGGENQFIIIGVQAGIIALIMYLVIYVSIIQTAYTWLYNLKGKEKKVCLSVLLIKIGFFIPLFTSEVESSSYISYLNWFLSGLFVSIMMHHKNKTVQQTKNDLLSPSTIS